ncbi:MAG: hypothetical protein KKF30_07535 [Proteobacteria bacterium]|nr:hypothetical protein [Pseudomonadota bacterium]MBU4470280.1 hypothetical protein [Pseudomonadota bacterium]MCG2752693.1 DUF6475 domain-containing protein [Desulfobacteraceae bacterium]
MDNNDFNDFANAMGSLAEIHGKEISPTLMKTYFKLFSNFSIEQIQKGVADAMLSLKYFPKPVELIELISGKPEDIAEVEVSKVLQAIRQYGAYSSICFDNPVTMAVILQGFGGWIKMCDELVEHEAKWFRKDFVKIYQAYAAQGIKSFGRLLGVHDHSNSVAGLETEDFTVLIGDQEKASAILEYKPEDKSFSGKLLRLAGKIGG